MAWTIDIDGNDITSICQQITWRPRLSQPASCVARFPAHLFSGGTVGVSEMHLYNGSLLFSGPVWYTQVDGDENTTYMEVTAYDHLIYFTKRMCRSGIGYGPADDLNLSEEPGPCNLADATAVITDNITAPEIMAAFIEAASDCDVLFPGGTPLPITVASASGGGADMTGVPSDWPMNIQTMADMLLSTGQLGIIVNPGFGSSSVNLTNGGYVNDLSGSVSIQYQTGAFNARGANRTRDMEEVINALWYLLGPKREQYPGDIAHYIGSITPTAPNTYQSWPPSLVARWTASRGTYGYLQEIQIQDTGYAEDGQPPTRPLYEEMFANEAYLRAVPRTFANVRADRTTAAPSFMVGDLISVSAGSRLAGGFSGAEIVYEYEITIDADGIGEFTDLVTSPDAT